MFNMDSDTYINKINSLEKDKLTYAVGAHISSAILPPYQEVTFIIDKQIKVTTTKNLASRFSNIDRLIFYFTQEYIFACSNKQSLNSDLSITCHPRLCIDIEKKTVLHGDIDLTSKSLKWIKEMLSHYKEAFLYYLNVNTSPEPFFYYSRIHNLGHDIMDCWIGVDSSIQLTKNSALLCCYENTTSTVLPDKCIRELFYNKRVYAKNNGELINAIINTNSLLINCISPLHTYNFLKTIKSLNLNSINNSNQVVLVTKYENKCASNQTELYKVVIDSFVKHKNIKDFFVFGFYNKDGNSANWEFLNKNRELINELKLSFPTLKIYSDEDLNFYEIIDKIYNSLCYVSPFGTIQHLVALLSGCQNGICYGMPAYASVFFSVPPKPHLIVSPEIITSSYIPEGFDKRKHIEIFEINLQNFKKHLDILIANML